MEIYLCVTNISDEFSKTEDIKLEILVTHRYISNKKISESSSTSEIYLCVSNISDEFLKTEDPFHRKYTYVLGIFPMNFLKQCVLNSPHLVHIGIFSMKN